MIDDDNAHFELVSVQANILFACTSYKLLSRLLTELIELGTRFDHISEGGLVQAKLMGACVNLAHLELNARDIGAILAL